MSDSQERETQGPCFLDESGIPIAFFLHKSIKLNWQRETLTKDITKYGGIVVDDPVDADTVLVHPLYELKEALQDSYRIAENRAFWKVWVEYSSFVRKCIRDKQYRHRVKQPKGMGGASSGKRVEFTPEDDEHLCRFLALKIPDPLAGGRTGLRVYRKLLESAEANPEEVGWAKRHTAYSWKERYKKRRHILDPRIQEIVDIEKPSTLQGHDQNRNYNSRGKFIGRRNESSSDESSSGSEQESVANQLNEHGEMEERRHIDDDRQPSHTTRGKHRMQNTSRNGYQNTEEEDEVLDREENEFSADEQPEAGPSMTQRSPSPTLVNPQAALSPSRQLANTKRRLAQPNKEHSSPHLITVPGELDADHSKQLALISSHSQVHSQQPEKINVRALRNSSQRRENPPPVRRQVARKVVSGPLSQEGAPFRNTRSRNRSVEPIAVPTQRRRAKKVQATRGKGRGVGLAGMAPEESPARSANTDLPMPSTETIEDEMNVQDSLHMVDPNDQNIFTVQDRHFLNQIAGQPEIFDSDDIQTNETLRSTQYGNLEVRAEEPPSGFRLGTHPDEILQRFQGINNRPRHSLPSTFTSTLRQPSAKANQIIQSRITEPHPMTVSSGNGNNRNKSSTPRRLRHPSTSGSESFPTPGTKASTIKRKLEEEEKQTPYKPPPGSRASRLTRLQ